MVAWFCTRNLTLRQCNVTKFPLLEAGGKDSSSFSDAVFEVVNNMTVPVTVLHITPMSAFRSDAHVGTWSDRPSLSDCSHWCLPGVPDVWNEIVISYLLGSNEPASTSASTRYVELPFFSFLGSLKWCFIAMLLMVWSHRDV